jgi:lycopene beta-cyclase
MGCAGLSLAVHMIHSGKFAGKKILLLDKHEKQENDRTWCFWETEPGLFESLVCKAWYKAWFYSNELSRPLALAPYTYKLIRGIDFYRYCLDLIRKQPNMEIKKGAIAGLGNGNGQAYVQMGEEKIFADYIFNSILFEKPVLAEKEFYLLQHFRGWIIETGKPVFNPGIATLMDFRVNQQEGTTFVYTMPFTPTKALVEYTVFSDKTLDKERYEEGLRKYIDQYIKPGNYNIKEEEAGIIPMTNHKFPAVDGRIVNIGTAGGQTKASSGYTFRFIQKHSARIVDSLVKKNNPFIALPAGGRRFRFYDSTLLYILQYNKVPGDHIFTRLFKKNKPQRLLRFLDNESSLIDEFRIISSLPALPFLKAAWKQR